MAVYINAQPWQHQYLFNDEQSGNLGAWATDSAVLPAGRGDGTAIIAKGFCFYFQGRNTSLVATATIYRAPVVDGVIGTFTLYGSIPSGLAGYARYDSRAILINDVVHLVGGVVGSTAVATVLSCPVNDDGSLGTWSLGFALPVTRRGHSLACANGYLYCVAGRSSSGSDRIYRASIYPTTDPNNGIVGPWVWDDTVNLPATRQYGVAFVIGDKLYYAGGYNDSFSAQSTIYVSTIGANGSLSSFTTYSIALPVEIANPQYAITGDTLYIVGGYGSNAVYYATIAADYSFGSFTAGGTLPTVVEGAPLVVSSSKAYLIGGSSGGSQTAIRSVAFTGGSDDYTGFDIGQYVAPLSISFLVEEPVNDVSLVATVPSVISFSVAGDADDVSLSATVPSVVSFDIRAEHDEVFIPMSTDTLFFAIDSPADEVAASFTTPIICSFAVEAPADTVFWAGYGENTGDIDFNIDARADVVSARFVNAANLFVVEAPADEVAMSIVVPSVLRIAARGYLDSVNAAFQKGRTEIAFSVQGYADQVQVTGVVPSVFRVDISSIDEISMSADVEQRVTGAFKVDCPPDSVFASFISHEPIRFSIDSARDDVSLSLFHVPVFNANIVADVDRVSIFLASQMALSNLSFVRDAHPDGALVDALALDTLRFSRGIVSSGTTPSVPPYPIHFSR